MSYIDLSTSGITVGAGASRYAGLTSVSSGAISLSGADVSSACRVTGVEDPASSKDAVNLQYLQQYVLGQIRGLSIKPSASLCSTSAISFTASSSPMSYYWAGSSTNNFASTSNFLDVLVSQSTNLAAVLPVSRLFANTTWDFTFGCKIRAATTNFGISDNQYLQIWRHGVSYGQSVELRLNGWGSNIGIQLNGSPLTHEQATALYSSTAFPANTDRYIYVRYSRSTGQLFIQLFDENHNPINTNAASASYTSPTTSFPSWGSRTTLTVGGSTDSYASGNINGTVQNILFSGSILTAQAALWDAPPGAPLPSWTSGIDGVSPTSGMRVLLTAQTSAIENGIYVVSGSSLVRAPDLAASSTAAGSFIFIDGQGVSNNRQGYVCNALPGADIVGTHSLLWTIFTSEDGHIGTTTIQGGLITDASGQISFLNNHLVTSGNVSASRAQLSTLALQAGQISDSSGALSFGGTALSTTGSMSASSLAASNCSTGTLKIAAGSLTDTSGQISLANTSMSTTGNLVASHFTVSSDSRLKSNITQLQVTLEDLDKLDGHAFRWLSTDLPDTGLIAQEVMTLAPEAVIVDPRTGMFAVDYARMVPYLIRWVKLLSEKV